MANTIGARFENLEPEQKELLIAELGVCGFTGFEEGEEYLAAFIPETDFDPETLKEVAEKYQLHFSQSVIEETNWNAVWESNFDPVIVDDFVAIRAAFHTPVKSVENEIIITPKMSFGTGHHATTYLMMQQMRNIDFYNKTVFDFGTGTGVLAILAEKLGAAKIIAADNDDWSIENANENFLTNGSSKITLEKVGDAKREERFDILLANINKNVITENFETMVNILHEDGILLLSGLLKEDEDDIMTLASAQELALVDTCGKNSWICFKLKKLADKLL